MTAGLVGAVDVFWPCAHELSAVSPLSSMKQAIIRAGDFARITASYSRIDPIRRDDKLLG
jgi:hypothetical protein